MNDPECRPQAAGQKPDAQTGCLRLNGNACTFSNVTNCRAASRAARALDRAGHGLYPLCIAQHGPGVPCKLNERLARVRYDTCRPSYSSIFKTITFLAATWSCAAAKPRQTAPPCLSTRFAGPDGPFSCAAYLAGAHGHVFFARHARGAYSQKRCPACWRNGGGKALSQFLSRHGTARPAEGAGQSGLVDLSTGQLPLEVVDAILCNLPVDVSFVGPDDRVAYYSDSAHRIFPRSAAVIGREVKNCHPPKSVHMVTEILEAFKRGERDKAEFWLELGGKFIHIEYLALRNKQGAYLGCLEVGQDATHLRALTGQRRLLEWE